VNLLKKYPTRRIYNTESSEFITLVDVREMVLQRCAFKVVHSKTGADLTRSVLMQIITEQENEGHASLLTNRALEELIRFYGDEMAHLVAPYVEQQILHFLREQDRVRQQFATALASSAPLSDQALKTAAEQFWASLLPLASGGVEKSDDS
jgi:polyhydroxyalkanoate synthesis repressor PhaR